MCRDLMLYLGMTDMVVILSIIQALGISTNNRTEDNATIKFRLRRDLSLGEEDCSQLIFLLEFILFILITFWLLLMIVFFFRYITRN